MKNTASCVIQMDLWGSMSLPDELETEVYDKASYVGVLKFYITHPSRFIEKLELSADLSVFIRPSYLDNYEKQDYIESLKFTERFSLWENLRKKTEGFAFYIIVIYSVIFLSIILYQLYKFFRNKNKDYHHLIKVTACLILLCTTAGQFIIPVVGNGEADLQKHMYLFNMCFDLMLLIGVMWFVDNTLNYRKLHNKYFYGVALVIVALIVVMNLPIRSDSDDVISIGETVTLDIIKTNL